MLLVAPRIVNSVSCVKRIQHEIHFSWQAQYLVRLEDVVIAPRIVNSIVNSVSCVKRIQHGIHFSSQAQYLVRLGDVACRTAHCK